MFADTHAHLNFKAFDKDFDKVIDECLSDNVWMINVGSNYDTSIKAIEIAEKYDNGVFAAVGLHPIHAETEDYRAAEYGNLCQSEKVVAIGEIGLDKFKDYGNFLNKQKEIFQEQLDLAKELGLPVIIHCRMAHDDMLEILNYKLRGVIHCFTGSWRQAEKYLNMGFYLGINGIMYKFDLKEVIEKAPLDKLLVETDCPYLGREGRNNPLFVKEIAKDIARIKSISLEEVAQATTQNAQILFNI
jgi:TatD DNase family protein